jgi:hypothetical protein
MKECPRENLYVNPQQVSWHKIKPAFNVQKAIETTQAAVMRDDPTDSTIA